MKSDAQQQRCRWCGEVKKISKEHLVPRWLGRELRLQHPDAVIGARYRLGSGDTARTWQDNDPFSIVVRKFCVDCNSGWMSRLEGAAQPHLMPLVNGTGHTFTTESQAIVAAWLFKTAYVYDVLGHGLHVPDEHRREFLDTGQPPAGVVVHLAPRTVGPELPPVIQQRLRRARFVQGELEVYKATIAIGHMIAQVIGFPGYRSAEGTEDMAVGATRIWPTSAAVSWPGKLPALSVDDTVADTTFVIEIGQE